MRMFFPRKSLPLLLALLPLAVVAQTPSANAGASQNTPIGKWRTIDDTTHKVKSIVEIYDAGNGSLSAKVVQVLQSDQGLNPLCVPCAGERHNKPVTGMVIAWGLKHEDSSWEDGKILDPHTGKIYSAKMTPRDGGAKLEVRGYMGFSLLGRSQTWIREQ